MYKQANLSFSVAAQANGNDVSPIQFSTQDKNSARLVFTIKEGKEPINLTDVDGEITLLMHDKSRFTGKVEVTEPLNGVIEYTITPEQIRHAGTAQGELTLKDKDGSSIGGFRFNFKIKKALIDEDLGPAKEFYIEDLEAVKEEVQKKADEIGVDVESFKVEIERKTTNIESNLKNINTSLAIFETDINDRTTELEYTVNSIDQNLAQTTVIQVETAKGEYANLNDRITSDVSNLNSMLTETKKDLAERSINVKASPYNAKGDGVTIDTNAIQKAFIDAYRNKKSVYFPKGVYIVDKPILIFAHSNEVASSINVQGENLENTVIKAHSTFNAHLSSGALANKSLLILVNERFLNDDNTFKNGTGSTHSVFISNLYLLSETQNVDYGILYSITNASSTYRQLRIRGFNRSGMKNLGHFYLNMLEKIRIDNSPVSFDFSTGINTSVKIDSCYSVGATQAGFKVVGVYMTMINPAVDGCSGVAYDLTGYNGTLVSPGSESHDAVNTFKGGRYTDVTITSAYTFMNTTNPNSIHILLDGMSAYVKFIGGRLNYDNAETDLTAPGKLYEVSGYQSILEFDSNTYLGKSSQVTGYGKYPKMIINGTITAQNTRLKIGADRFHSTYKKTVFWDGDRWRDATGVLVYGINTPFATSDIVVTDQNYYRCTSGGTTGDTWINSKTTQTTGTTSWEFIRSIV